MVLKTLRNAHLLSIVVPMYNESDGIEIFFNTLKPILENCKQKRLVENYEIICIDDGSVDETANLLTQKAETDSQVKLLKLSRNFGKEVALTAGLDHASGDIIIPIDADLQDSPEIIPEMIEQWQNGFDVVLAKRKNRDTDSALKRFTAKLFYYLIGKISHINIPANAGDFRLIDRKVLNSLVTCKERTRFMKGLFAWQGFSTTEVLFTRQPRAAGEPKQNYRSLIGLALDGIFSFSTAPLRIWMWVGVWIATISLVYAGMIMFRTLFLGVDVPGYASIMTTVLFIGGIQLISLGVLGEYISRIYKEVKQRPLYIVDVTIGLEDKNT
jgi:glycosyltransferase involved in cell wall biosynthesis